MLIYNQVQRKQSLPFFKCHSEFGTEIMAVLLEYSKQGMVIMNGGENGSTKPEKVGSIDRWIITEYS